MPWRNKGVYANSYPIRTWRTWNTWYYGAEMQYSLIYNDGMHPIYVCVNRYCIRTCVRRCNATIYAWHIQFMQYTMEKPRCTCQGMTGKEYTNLKYVLTQCENAILHDIQRTNASNIHKCTYTRVHMSIQVHIASPKEWLRALPRSGSIILEVGFFKVHLRVLRWLTALFVCVCDFYSVTKPQLTQKSGWKQKILESRGTGCPCE